MKPTLHSPLATALFAGLLRTTSAANIVQYNETECSGTGAYYPIEPSDVARFYPHGASLALITVGLPCSIQVFSAPGCKGPVFFEHDNSGSETFCTDFPGVGGSFFVQCDDRGEVR